MSSNILVAVRCRPTKEPKSIVHVLNSKSVILTDPSHASDNYLQNRFKEKQYTFDLAFGGEASQEAVYSSTAKNLVHEARSGFNSTVFAYGATGAGKTFTMLSDNGLVFRALSDLYTLSHKDIKLSFLEIYNEVVNDLLSPGNDNLDIREDRYKGIAVPNLTEIAPYSAQEACEVIRDACKIRSCESTDANKTSSRSHAVLQAVVSTENANVRYTGKFSLIDLAGSERAAKTNNRGIRLIEGANINRSLLALGNCINALSESHTKGSHTHIPYRDSKLTRLLKDSLGGNCKTVMIACVSPSLSAFEDTHNTFEYASRAKNIRTQAVKNETVKEKNEIIKLEKNVIQKHDLKEKNVVFKNDIKEKIVIHKHDFKEKSAFSLEPYVNELHSHFQKELDITNSIIRAKRNGNSDNDIRPNNLRKALEELEFKRKELQSKWETHVPEPYKTILDLHMTNHLLNAKISETDFNEQKANALLKAKDEMIKVLTNQLELRDHIIESTTHLLESNDVSPPHSLISTLKDLKPLRDLKPRPVISVPKLSTQNRSHSPSRIPKPPMKKALQKNGKNIVTGYSSRHVRGSRNDNGNRAISANSTVGEKSQYSFKKPVNVSKKVGSSPYVLGYLAHKKKN